MEENDYKELPIEEIILRLRKDLIIDLIILSVFFLIVFISLMDMIELFYFMLFFGLIFMILPITVLYLIRKKEIKSEKFHKSNGKLKMNWLHGKGFTAYTRYHFDGKWKKYYDVLNQCRKYKNKDVELIYTKVTRLIVQIKPNE